MHYFIDDEYSPIRELVRDFAIKEVEPGAAARDESEEPDPAILEKMARIGLTGVLWPEQYGGSGLDMIANCIVIEELSRVCASTGSDLAIHTALAGWMIDHYGNEEQKQKYLTPLAEGRCLGAFALTEPGAGSDIAGIRTTAVAEGDHYVLNGGKVFTSNAGPAGIYVVFCKTNPAAGDRGMSAFIVEKGYPGFSIGEPIKKMGIRAHAVAGLYFDDCRVPAANLLGQPGDGYTMARSALQSGRLAISAQAVGIAQGAFDLAKAYSFQRQQFGNPISEFQTIQFKFAEMATKIEAARLMVYHAAWLAAHGHDYAEASSMSKILAAKAATEVTTEAMTIFGGYGFARDYPIERLVRDARITPIYTGTVDIQKIEIAEALFSREANERA